MTVRFAITALASDGTPASPLTCMERGLPEESVLPSQLESAPPESPEGFPARVSHMRVGEESAK